MIKLNTYIILLLPFVLVLFHPLSAMTVHNVVNFGAKKNGMSDASQAFHKAWKAACSTVGPAVIEIPKGKYLLKPLTLVGRKCNNTDITIQINGSLIAPLDYRILGNAGNWLTLKEVSGVSIIGGVLDAKGSAWWDCKTSGGNCPGGATTLRFVNSRNIWIKGLTSLNSQMFHIVINGCQNVRIEGVQIIASASSPNTDGIHVQSSMDVTIVETTMRTGDDCISVGPGTKSLWIENVLCGPGHGISIGSLAKDKEEQGVQNVTVQSVVLSNTTNGLRIKSWARESNGFVQGVLFKNITMRNVQNPIIVDQHYCPNKKDCPSQASSIKISNVTYDGIHGTSATEVAVMFDCSSMYPCTGITLQDITLENRNQVAKSTCSNVEGEALGVVQPDSCF